MNSSRSNRSPITASRRRTSVTSVPQPEDRLLIKWSRAAPGQRDDLEARSGHGAQPLGDDDGQAVPAGQPRHIINKDQGVAISEVKVVEQQHRTRVLCRRDEQLAHGHEPALTRRRKATLEGSLDLGSTSRPVRDRAGQGASEPSRREPRRHTRRDSGWRSSDLTARQPATAAGPPPRPGRGAASSPTWLRP